MFVFDCFIVVGHSSLLAHFLGKVFRFAEFESLRLLCFQCFLGSFRDHLPFLLSQKRKDTDGHGIRVRDVATGEVHIGISELKDEACIPGKPVELGDHKRSIIGFGKVDRFLELDAPVVLAGLDFSEFGKKLIPGDKVLDGRSLCMKP